MRTKHLLSYGKSSFFIRLMAAAVATGAIVTEFAVASPLLAQPLQVTQTLAQHPARVDLYQRWLDEDVRWIATSAERTQFMGLSTDEARDAFIVKFWQLRSSSADGNGHRFREEHYRRLAYANTNFASALPGWSTDRGHIYILNGQPDSIDVHRAGGVYSNGRPYEVWHYRAKDVEMRFVDVCSCGDYRLETNIRQ